MTTIQKNRILGRVAIAAVLATCLAAPVFAAANGPAPTLNITSPTAASIVYLSSFPATVPVNFTVKMNGESELQNLNVLDATVDESSLYGDAVGNPFDTSNACTASVTSGTRTCSVTDSKNASLSVPWTVNGVGTYTIVVSGKFRGAEGIDEETVQVATFSAEYPAPPAVANAYINSQGKTYANAKQRGCIIAQIAEQHAQYEAYGPKGGPYNQSSIVAAVQTFAAGCIR